MKNISFLSAGVLFFLIFTTVFYSCKKYKNEKIHQVNGYGDPIAAAVPYTPVDNYLMDYITNSISVASTSPHLLVFPTKANFEYTRGELERLNGIFEVPDSLQDSVHLDPILEKFEGTFSGYRSLRQDIVDEIDSLSDANVYNPFTYDPDDHFIGDIFSYCIK